MIKKTQTGLTLLEIGIIIIIIGLVIAGIITANGLMQQARLKTVISDVRKYQTAYKNFTFQYNALPGDIENAYDYWGEMVGCEDRLSSAKGNGCNGNGNNIINAPGETYRAWQHLALAGLIYDRSYHGLGGGSTGQECIPQYNVPDSALKKGGYMLLGGEFGREEGKNYISLGAMHKNQLCKGALLTPKDAYSIDLKIDDGKPLYGKMVAENGYFKTGTCIYATMYALKNNQRGCMIEFAADNY